MKLKRLVVSSISFLLINSSLSCAVQSNISPTAPDLLATQPVITEVGPTSPKLRIKLKQTEIEVAEQDLNKQINAIFAASENKKIKDVKVSIIANNQITSEGYYLQNLPLTSKPLSIPFSTEGTIKVQPNNIIEMEVSKIKVAGIPIKSLMDTLGIELSGITGFKDNVGRVELKGNNFLFILEKFTNQSLINGQIKSIQTTDKAVKLNF